GGLAQGPPDGRRRRRDDDLRQNVILRLGGGVGHRNLGAQGRGRMSREARSSTAAGDSSAAISAAPTSNSTTKGGWSGPASKAVQPITAAIRSAAIRAEGPRVADRARANTSADRRAAVSSVRIRRETMAPIWGRARSS